MASSTLIFNSGVSSQGDYDSFLNPKPKTIGETRFGILASQLENHKDDTAKKSQINLRDFSTIPKPTNLDPLPPEGKSQLNESIIEEIVPEKRPDVSIEREKGVYEVDKHILNYLLELVNTEKDVNKRKHLKALEFFDIGKASSDNEVKEILKSESDAGFISKKDYLAMTDFLSITTDQKKEEKEESAPLHSAREEYVKELVLHKERNNKRVNTLSKIFSSLGVNKPITESHSKEFLEAREAYETAKKNRSVLSSSENNFSLLSSYKTDTGIVGQINENKLENKERNILLVIDKETNHIKQHILYKVIGRHLVLESRD
jgi:hypothetical protein